MPSQGFGSMAPAHHKCHAKPVHHRKQKKRRPHKLHPKMKKKATIQKFGKNAPAAPTHVARGGKPHRSKPKGKHPCA